MTDRCKLGDIAIIVRDLPGCELNIGRVVRVGGPRKVFAWRGTVWRIVSVNGDTMTYLGYDGTVATGPATDIEHEDDWLLPITPEADDDHIEQVEVEPVPKELESI